MVSVRKSPRIPSSTSRTDSRLLPRPKESKCARKRERGNAGESTHTPECLRVTEDPSGEPTPSTSDKTDGSCSPSTGLEGTHGRNAYSTPNCAIAGGGDAEHRVETT